MGGKMGKDSVQRYQAGDDDATPNNCENGSGGSARPGSPGAEVRRSMRRSIGNAAKETVAISDVSVILVGKNDETLERLALARLAAKGRAIVLVTDEKPVFTEASDFMWLPPRWDKTAAPNLCKKLHSSKPTRWTKKGPDVAVLQPGQFYETGAEGIRVLSKGTEGAEDSVVWEALGCVVFADDPDALQKLDVKDPRAMPMPLFSERVFLQHWVQSFCVHTFMFALSGFEGHSGPPFARLPVSLVMMPIWGNCMHHVWGPAFTGKSLPGQCGVHIVVGIVLQSLFTLVPFGELGYLSPFWTCALSVTFFIGLCLPHYCYKVKTMPWMWQWGVANILLTLGFWVVFGILTTGYVILVGYSKTAAGIFLPISTGITEAVGVGLVGKLYRAQVYNKNAPGDQGAPLMNTIACIHCYAEGSRLVGIVANAAINNKYDWWFSIVLSVAMNTCARYGYVRWALVKFSLAIGSVKGAVRFAPVVGTKMHDETKYTCGYFRFCVPIGLALTRGVQGLEPLYTTAALVCLVCLIVAEMVEDFVVRSELIKMAPFLAPYDGYVSSMSPFDPRQLFNVDCQEFRKKEGRLPRLSSSSNGATRGEATHSVAEARKKGRLPRCLGLHGTRVMSYNAMPFSCPATIYVWVGLQFLLGAGFVAGVCEKPLDPDQRLGGFVFYASPLPCGYNSPVAPWFATGYT